MGMTIEQINDLINTLYNSNQFEDLTTQLNFYLGEELDFAEINMMSNQVVSGQTPVLFTNAKVLNGVDLTDEKFVLRKGKTYYIEYDVTFENKSSCVLQFRDLTSEVWINTPFILNDLSSHGSIIVKPESSFECSLFVKEISTTNKIDYTKSNLVIHEITRAQVFEVVKGERLAWLGSLQEYRFMLARDEIEDYMFYVATFNDDIYLYLGKILLNYAYNNKQVLRLLSEVDGKLYFDGKPVETNLEEAIINYELSINKPLINNVELIGNKSFGDLGLYFTTELEADIMIENILEEVY